MPTSAGNVLVTGLFSGVADFGAGPLTSAGDLDVFVAKYAPNGTHLWAIRGGGTQADRGLFISADRADNVIVGGTYFGTGDFGGGPRSTSASSRDLFLAKYGPTGIHLWSKALGGPGTELLGGLAVDPGGLWLSGSFSETADFGGGPLTALGSSDVILLRRAP